MIRNMTVASLAQTIRKLPSKKRIRLFDRLQPSLEDYLLAKIAQDRFEKRSQKHIPWDALKR